MAKTKEPKKRSWALVTDEGMQAVAELKALTVLSLLPPGKHEEDADA